MSFFSQRAVCCFGDQFQYYLLIEYIKTPMALKRQWFKDSESNATEPKASKCPCVDVYDNKKEQNLEEYKDKDDRYFLSFLFLKKS